MSKKKTKDRSNKKRNPHLATQREWDRVKDKVWWYNGSTIKNGPIGGGTTTPALAAHGLHNLRNEWCYILFIFYKDKDGNNKYRYKYGEFTKPIALDEFNRKWWKENLMYTNEWWDKVEIISNGGVFCPSLKTDLMASIDAFIEHFEFHNCYDETMVAESDRIAFEKAITDLRANDPTVTGREA